MSVVGVDLFCGVGGLTHGLERAGIEVAAGIDLDSDCRYPYEANNGAEFIEENVAELSGRSVTELYPEDSCKLLAGCAPCQPFSNYNNGRESSEMDDWGLLGEFGRLVREVKPELIAVENVIEIRNHRIYSDFIDLLFGEGYKYSVNKVECREYGVPQSRKRLVVLASKYGLPDLIDPTHEPYAEGYRTVRDVIGGDTLNPVEAGEVDDEDTLHRSQHLSKTNLERIRQSEPGGTWRDWDEDLRADCHKKSSGSSYQSVYGRMEWDEPAPTITTQFYGFGSGRFGHPEQDRALSLREGAMLQTFPKDYSFVSDYEEEIHFNQIGRFIGNAVPVRIGEVIGESIIHHLETHDVEIRPTERSGAGNAVRDVAQPQRAESPGAESLQ